MADDKKTLKFQMMMSPGEAEVLDNWMFQNRIRSRAEAIRRLCQIGLLLDGMADEMVALVERVRLLVDALPNDGAYTTDEDGDALVVLVHLLWTLAGSLTAAAGTMKEADDASLQGVNERKERIMRAYRAAREAGENKKP